MGNKVSIRKIGFEDVKYLLNKGTRFIIINTLDERDQACLIKGTISPTEEISIINKAISNPTLHIVIYGRNYTDESIYKKYEKLLSLGLIIFLYMPEGYLNGYAYRIFMERMNFLLLQKNWIF